MDSTPVPIITAFDALTQALAAVCYLTVAIPALVRRPNDIRTRVFLAFAMANAVAFVATSVAWQQGAKTLLELPRWSLALLLAGLSAGALLLFHFSQVFPRRRPWLRTSGVQMTIAYALVPFAVAGLVLFAPGAAPEVTGGYIAAALVFGFPLLVLLAFVLPVAAIVSLVRSYRDGAQPELAPARVPIALTLVSQIAGGALALISAPVLASAAPVAQLGLALVMWVLGIGTPIAFALAVWKYNVLAINPD